jgi:hypothetical protein
MLRLPLSNAVSTYGAVVLAFISIIATVLVHIPSQLEPPTSSISHIPAPAPEDLTSLMQAKVYVELDSITDSITDTREQDTGPAKVHVELDRITDTREEEMNMLTKDVQETQSMLQKQRQASPPSDQAKLKGNVSQTAQDTAQVLSTGASVRSAFNIAVIQFTERVGVQSTFSFMLVLGLAAMVIVLLFCTTTSLWQGFPLRGQQGSSSAGAQSPKDRERVMEQRERMLTHTSPFQSANRMYQRPGITSPGAVAKEPFLRTMPGSSTEAPRSGLHMPAPREVSDAVGLSPRLSITEQQQRLSAKPPALCPTLVMPMSEALLGIQMYELAQLSEEGDINIVGISAKPLLRASIKKVGNARALEIAMPESNSIPRASIAPATVSSSPDLQRGSRALEIKGMRGTPYGMLEMRSSGACYVVKDGQTVLTIDGDPESLQLALKSSVGLQLASVRCSTEHFDGIDHVEIRVEAGVDTVLVVAVVLAVLLLSPYLPPVDYIAA